MVGIAGSIDPMLRGKCLELRNVLIVIRLYLPQGATISCMTLPDEIECDQAFQSAHLGISVDGGTPQNHLFVDGDFPWNQPSSYGATPTAKPITITPASARSAQAGMSRPDVPWHVFVPSGAMFSEKVVWGSGSSRSQKHDFLGYPNISKPSMSGCSPLSFLGYPNHPRFFIDELEGSLFPKNRWFTGTA